MVTRVHLTDNDIGSTVQAQLVSATNIKTINGSSVLGSGDLTVSGSGINYGGIRTDAYIAGALTQILFGTATTNTTINQLVSQPFLLQEDETFTRIGIQVVTAVAGDARLGIYSAVDGAPDTLILDAGTVSTSTTGLKEITISQALTAGLYFLVVVHDATAALCRSGGTASILNGTYGQDASTGQYILFNTTFTYGALPSTHPTPTPTTNSNQPAIWLRKV